MNKNEQKPEPKEIKQASSIIAIGSIIGLTTCVIFAIWQQAEISPYLYAIFGGGILGTDNVVKFIRAVLRNEK